MNSKLKQKLDAFRSEWSRQQAQRFPVHPHDSDERKAEAQRIQDGLNEKKQLFYKVFNSDEQAEIAKYLADLRPQVIETEPTPLDASHPQRVREVDAEIMNEFYFLREFFPD